MRNTLRGEIPKVRRESLENRVVKKWGRSLFAAYRWHLLSSNRFHFTVLLTIQASHTGYTTLYPFIANLAGLLLSTPFLNIKCLVESLIINSRRQNSTPKRGLTNSRYGP